MSEKVHRVRALAYDENNDPLPDTGGPPFELTARGVEPGASEGFEEYGRNGEEIAYTVYFTKAVDLTNDDDLIVRGDRYGVRVADWRSAFGTGRRAMVVFATLSRG
ncbi:hypothetical protein [Rhodococcus tibetensis]|uniref:Head-to-tail stopper n=1 Tax=Rhodococcus tibetensis TaxID=2965064 RepID=A0ABT1QCG2_9NOCA|nr:hypothetical protein [Rhodococcus sp. FXJ9.536]MCQ4119882.1 hypothetical protein [Rhodococcus sp. FXJ9.536]